MKSPGTVPLLLLPWLLLAACSKDEGDSAIQTCTELVAEAGEDQSVILGGTVLLDASASQVCEGLSPTYTWHFESVPADSALTDGDFSDNGTESAVQVTFTPDVVGTYVVSLVLAGDGLQSRPDLVVVTVSSENRPPVAACAGPESATVGERVHLDGSASYDPEGSDLTYSWTLSTLPAGSSLEDTDIYNSGTPTPSLVPDAAGTYVVALVVSDGLDWSDPAYCSFSVSDGNQPPIADAGPGGTLPPCTGNPLTLDGYASYDPEGASLSYQWSLVSAPAGSSASDASFEDPTRPDARFRWDLPGEYTFQLQVFDGELWSAPDLVTYEIADLASDHAPVVNAGEDVTVDDSTTCYGSAYTEVECEPCTGESITLDGSASYDPDGDPLTYQWSEPEGELVFSNPNGLVTDVALPTLQTELDTTNTRTWTVTLEIADCEHTASDTVTVTYSCTGEW